MHTITVGGDDHAITPDCNEAKHQMRKLVRKYGHDEVVTWYSDEFGRTVVVEQSLPE